MRIPLILILYLAAVTPLFASSGSGEVRTTAIDQLIQFMKTEPGKMNEKIQLAQTKALLIKQEARGRNITDARALDAIYQAMLETTLAILRVSQSEYDAFIARHPRCR